VLIIKYLYFVNMAIILYSALISQIRGKLQGSVFSKSGAGQIITNRGVPRKTPTVTQLAERSGFTVNAYLWNEITEAQRQAWRDLAGTIPVQNRIGETVFLTGFLYFRKVMSLIYPLGATAPFLADPLAGNAQEATFEANEFDVESTELGWSVTLADFTAVTINATAAAQHILIGISLPLSAGATKYYGTYYRALTEEFTPPNSVGTTFFPSIINKLMPKGWYTYEGAVHRFRMQFVVPGSGSISVEKFNDLAVTITIPTVFPSVEADLTAPGSLLPRWSAGSQKIIGTMAYAIGDPLVNYSALYKIQIQAGAPQIDMSPIDPIFYIPLNEFNLLYDVPFETNTLGAGTPLTNFFAWYNATIGPWPTSQVGYYLPYRARLLEISSGEIGPFTVGFFLIGA
jgi:hypothetical protein